MASTCFKTGPPGQVGVELEWFCHDSTDPAAPVPASRLAATLGPHLTGQRSLPARGTLTCEPGGQLEISSLPAPSLPSCVSSARADLDALGDVLVARGLRLHGAGLDPLRPPSRVLDLPRYLAMEAFFDRTGPDGRVMMCSTASVQVCLDAGQEGAGVSGFRHRWRLVHALGPVLVAAFANSPLQGGRPTGWRSTRQAVWSRLDPGRTRPVPEPLRGGGSARGAARGVPGDGALDPREAWARYALDAQVLCVRTARGPWERPVDFTFRDWVRCKRPRPPTQEDLDYHLSTLFPPVRPKGWLELRMIDAQPVDAWAVPLAVVTALVEDAVAADHALAAVEPLEGAAALDEGEPLSSPWLRAARHGLRDPALAAAAQACFAAALDALPRLGLSGSALAAVHRYADRYVARGRTPADDRLAEWRADAVPPVKETVPC
ncbi:MAG: ergothioneine biosynthesis glutamate--cysteine ligase EgtA [Actinomycetes bacterium]